MPQANIFRWRAGTGWMILAGGGAPDSDDNFNIEAGMLTRTVSQGPIAYVWAAGDIETADRHMDALRDLGARTGYLIDILTEDDESLQRELSEAGVIILGDGPRTTTLRDALVGVSWRAIEESFNRGATLYIVGRSAAIIGAHMLPDAENTEVEDHTLRAGAGWLADALIVPRYTPDQADALRAHVARLPAGGYGLGIAEGAALAFGPNSTVEVWGNAKITVSLGSSYDSGV
ncbi:MAG: hypothetical protein JXA10_05455 [Anaerolineae bacterium]|nr:hypothetical protein [Anaerolineae bacterium]